MAKLSKGILGGISGKIGNIVGASWRGIDYIRSKPSKVNNPKTEAQQRQRARFGLIMALLKKMKPFLQIGFRGSAHKQTPLNAAMSVNIREAITGEFPDFEVDTSKLTVSTGNLHGSSNASLDLSAAENATITWQSEAGISNASDEDVLMVLLYNQARNPSIFYRFIASGDYNLEEAQEELQRDLLENKSYQFNTAEIPASFIRAINGITKKDILKHVFNASAFGKIEYTRIANNSREVAFRLKTADSGQHFCLLVASDATKWSDNILEDYEYTETPLIKSYFKTINEKESGINILLGSRIFTEGWDSNRPNVVNFINIGVDESAQKFVLQAIGRGVRIQPIPGIRKRISYIINPEETKEIDRYIDVETKNEIIKRSLAPESLFVFATKKEVIKNITENLNREKEADDWKIVKNIKKTEISEKLIIPKYEEAEGEIPAYSINQEEFDELINYIGAESGLNDKLVLMQSPTNVSKTLVSALGEIRNTDNFNFDVSHSGKKPVDNLLLLNHHFHQKPKKLKYFQPVLTEINHFEKIEVANLPENELHLLEQTILESLNKSELTFSTAEEAGEAFKNNEIDFETFQEQLALFTENKSSESYSYNGVKLLNINTDFLAEHYYNPILLTSETNRQLFKHIIWVDSEVEFLRELQKNRTVLEKYEWWYFSKIEETTDEVSIPYYDTGEQEYRNFFPDFIFWLKEKESEKLIIKFIDPKGNRVGTGNAEDKAKGYEEIFIDNNITFEGQNVEVDLFFYNEPSGVNRSVKEYFTKDFNKLFS